jgi:hypothetical protein
VLAIGDLLRISVHDSLSGNPDSLQRPFFAGTWYGGIGLHFSDFLVISLISFNNTQLLHALL